ncbi:hypothetical protein TCAL_09030 [Tigriopus californicus]|uniref:Innexin n=1 Tax=Tigriopus californicus TaxID=6832 RepID=A0A553ND69_TIGCA|nr:innexin inx2-like [Tigriopus californicus]TRY63377.1 hypothetical protein TCAL_09030 [Tigriopus californicus]|eukprot:TCALIF_09030-PA protein Name:"Similar to inx2 Innexin inx2 (Schistocerca americana)" AED:0.44 eAED:0.44 QI:0/-1/0/1/-1/1/1/0/386
MSLIGLLSSLKGGLSHSHEHVNTVSTTFSLHRVTAYALLAASLFSTATQFFGGPIHCYAHKSQVPSAVLDTFCWTHGTSTVDSDDVKMMTHPGMIGTPSMDEDDTILRHTYYQWVCFVLFFQALFFYMPYKIWKHAENGRIANMVKLADEQDENKPNALGEFLFTHYGSFSCLVLKYFLCECLAFVNVFLQIYLMDSFLGGAFIAYGSQVLQHDSTSDAIHPMSKFFPRITKCTWSEFSSSGSFQKVQAVCVMPLNVINEKIFLILWFWMLFLFLFTLLHFIFEIIVFLSSVPRLLVLRGFSPRTPKHLIRTVIRLADYGDWFVLVQLAKNLETTRFKATLEYLARHMRFTLDEDDNNHLDYEPNFDPSRKSSRYEMNPIGKVALV